MKALITGITGFAGSHLAEYLLEQGVEVHGIYRWRSRMENIEHLNGKIKLHLADMKDPSVLRNLINEVQPDYIFHLAAQSYVPVSWTEPVATTYVNYIGTINLFEAVRASDCDPVIQVAGSSEEYGTVLESECPIKETNPLRPLSPYAVTKVACDKLCYQYHKSYGMKTIATRGFNHTGPRRGEVFVTSNFAKQIVQIEKGINEPVMYVGNLEARRDFTDVRDTVRGYHLAVQKCKPGQSYNICSGKTWRIQQVLDILLNLSTVNVQVRQDPSRMRPSDLPLLLGDNSKFKLATGWEPTIPFEKTMADLMDYWRARI
jgi:GDP-4-dehydro-6-deoxy-D-mannose reductase